MARALLALAPGCRPLPEAAALETPGGRLDLGRRGPAAAPGLQREVLGRLAGGAAEEDLAALALERAGPEGLELLYPLLFELHERLLLGRRLRLGGGSRLDCLPLAPACPFGPPALEQGGRYLLSRFALLRRSGSGFVLESPLGLARVRLRGPRGTALVTALAEPADPGEVAAAAGLAEEEATAALELLAHAGALASPDPEGRLAEDSGALGRWQLHDLLFHARSRWGRHLGGYGATFRFGGGPAPPLPEARPAEPVGAAIPLPPPATRDGEPTLDRLLEERRCRRAHGEPPIGLAELGELLYRSARATERPGAAGVAAGRLYPAGGGLYELDLYLAVGRCRGLEGGLYLYRPREHSLAPVAADSPEVQRLLEMAASITSAPRPVQVLVLLAARFGEMSWKYESMAYATVLKDAGVLLQTLCLVAVAMDLAACPLGGGDSDLFARAAGTDPWACSSVAELILGSPAGPR